MGVFSPDVQKPVVSKDPVKVSYYNKKTQQYELVLKGSKAEKLLIRSKSWELKAASAKK